MTFLKIDHILKMSETETHVFFLNGPYSQWYPSDFEQSLTKDGPLLKFNCAEQYMMAGKAYLFDDPETLATIMAVEQDPKDWRIAPRRLKALGRQVQNYVEETWVDNRCDIVFRGNWAKFDQVDDLGQFIDSYAFGAQKKLVEGADYDRIWGVGLRWDDPRIIQPNNWRGLNLLGETLIQVRMYRELAKAQPGFKLDIWRNDIWSA
jgi:ribA/ribD-fused uncharacterized protein